MEPIEVVERLYRAFAARDFDEILRLVSPEVVIEQDPALPWGGRHEGHEGLQRFVLALLGAIDSEVTVHELFAAGDRVVQYGRTAGTTRANGNQFDIPECHVWTVADGQVVAGEYFIDSTAMLAVLSTATSGKDDARRRGRGPGATSISGAAPE